MRKNLQSKIIFIKTLDISTSVENTTFIKYALISQRIEYAITPLEVESSGLLTFENFLSMVYTTCGQRWKFNHTKTDLFTPMLP